MLTLRFLATGTFQSVVGELFGVEQTTASRTINRVTKAIVRLMPKYVKLPSQQEADIMKAKFYEKASFPNVIGCIDGTQVRILAPTENEHEYINRKNFHSINVQVTTTLHLYQTNLACHVLNFRLPLKWKQHC